VIFKLAKEADFKLSYGSISSELEKIGNPEPNIGDVAKIIAAIRASKLPDYNIIGNAGSFFKNPVITFW